jgi:hypothetical protein
MVEKKTPPLGPTKSVSMAPEMVGATGFECSAHDPPFKTDSIEKLNAHLREEPHEIAFGNYPCKMCGKIVTIVPDYLDKPSPGSGLPEDNTKILHEKNLMVKKRPETAQVAGGLGVCDDCRQRLRDQLA